MNAEILNIISKRKIKEVVHFTSNSGFLGTVACRQLKSRNLLKSDEYIAHILKLNTKSVYDAAWKDYINLSITSINFTLFDISSKYWYRNEKWRILAFSPEILAHPGVYFVTTNNAYEQHLKRGTGSTALEDLFAPTVLSRYAAEINRSPLALECQTTDIQAEVLYPHTLATSFLTTVYVENETEENIVRAHLAAVQHPEVDIAVAPEKFIHQKASCKTITHEK